MLKPLLRARLVAEPADPSSCDGSNAQAGVTLI
jgi:hypothetical protein